MLTLLALTFACGDAQTDDTGGPETDATNGSPHCEETTSSIARDDDSAIGIPASDLLDALPYARDLAIDWEDGQEDTVTWSFEADESTLVFVESEAVYPETGGASPAIEVICTDSISVDGVLTLSSDDGRLSESLSTSLRLSGGGSDMSEGPLAIVSVSHEVDAFDGTLDVSDFADTTAYDALTAMWSGEVYFATEYIEFVGQLGLMGEKSDGNIVTVNFIDIATWGPTAD